MARFPVTYCSNCGNAFGPGDHGFSHCKNHKDKRPLTAREESAALAAAPSLSADEGRGMMSMQCVVCKRGPNTTPSASLFRINAKGVPGLWACAKHLKQTDAPPLDPDLAEIARILEGRT